MQEKLKRTLIITKKKKKNQRNLIEFYLPVIESMKEWLNSLTLCVGLFVPDGHYGPAARDLVLVWPVR